MKFELRFFKGFSPKREWNRKKNETYRILGFSLIWSNNPEAPKKPCANWRDNGNSQKLKTFIYHFETKICVISHRQPECESFITKDHLTIKRKHQENYFPRTPFANDKAREKFLFLFQIQRDAFHL